MANTLIIRFYCPFRKPFIYKGRIVENPQMKQRRRGGNSKTNVQLSRTRARGAEARVRARPAELAPAAHGWAGARPGRPGGGAGGGSCASVTRGDPGSVPSSPPALRARRSVPLANHGAAAGSSRARGSPWFPSPAVGRRCSRRSESPSPSLGSPFGPRGSGSLHTGTAVGRAEGSRPRVLSPSTRFRLVGESLRRQKC